MLSSIFSCGISRIPLLNVMSVARQKIRAASADDFLFLRFALIGSLESPPSNLLRATRKPDILVLSEIHG